MKVQRPIFIIALMVGSLLGNSAFAAAKQTQRSTLTVFAAASLGQTFTTIGKAFEAKHPGVSVRFSFLASSTLATQMLAGAPVDVFASAAVSDMALVKSIVPDPKIFAENRVVLATPKGNHFHINKIVDLNVHGVKWIQCAHVVPCGAAADSALANEGRVTSSPVSLEANVSGAVAKVVNGEVDAAIIYHTDFVAHRATLNEIRFKSIAASTTRYPIGVVKASSQQALAKSFVDSVLSAYGRKILAEAGFSRAK